MGKVLLVVDDSQTIRTAVELIFEGSEYRVIAKETGEAGLAWMRTHTPDLILVDERMPDMDGYDFGEKVKSNTKNEDVPILLLACKDGPDESKADNADLDGYVNKPFGSQELVTLVEMLTGSSQISQMPLSFKEQLAQRHRDRQARVARGEAEAEPEPSVDELLSLEAALTDTKPPAPKKDEPVVEIPIVENEEQIAPIRIDASKAVTATIDLRPRSEPEPVEPEPKLVEPKAEPKPALPKEPPRPTIDIEEDAPEEDDFTPEPVVPERALPIPTKDLMEPMPAPPPPPRFPPPPTGDLPKREGSPVRRPRPEPSISLRDAAPPPPPPPRPPPIDLPSKTPDLLVKIETPIESSQDFAEDDEHTDDDAPLPPELPPPPTPPVEPEIAMEEPSEERPLPPPPQAAPSSSRGILFALLALAVIGGLVAFYFVSQ